MYGFMLIITMIFSKKNTEIITGAPEDNKNTHTKQLRKYEENLAEI